MCWSRPEKTKTLMSVILCGSSTCLSIKEDGVRIQLCSTLFKYTPVQLWHSQACMFPVNETELCPRKHQLPLQARCQSWHALMMFKWSLKQDWTVLVSSWVQNQPFYYYTLLKIITQRNLWHKHSVACWRRSEQKQRTCLQSAAHCSLTFSKNELWTIQSHWLFLHFF